MILALALVAVAGVSADVAVPAGIDVQDVHVENGGTVWVVTTGPTLRQLTDGDATVGVSCPAGRASFQGGGRYLAVTPASGAVCIFDRATGAAATLPLRGALRSAANWGGAAGWQESWVTADHATAITHAGGFTVMDRAGTQPLSDTAGKPLALGYSKSGNWVAAALVLPDGRTTIVVYGDRDERSISLLGPGAALLLQGLDGDGLRGSDAAALTPDQKARYAELSKVCDGDCIDGQGATTFGDSHTYSGEWKDGRPNGTGTLAARDGSYVYTGLVKDGAPMGGGRMTWRPGVWYEGAWQQGKRHGEGKSREASGIAFSGRFEADQPSQGTVSYADGASWTGKMKDGKADGWGTFKATDGSTFQARMEAGTAVERR